MNEAIAVGLPAAARCAVPCSRMALIISAETTAVPVLGRVASPVRPPFEITPVAPGLASGWPRALCCSSPGLREANALYFLAEQTSVLTGL